MFHLFFQQTALPERTFGVRGISRVSPICSTTADIDGRCTTAAIDGRCNWKPYCEDPRLSINNAGQVFKALYVPPETPTISHEDRDQLLMALCSCYDLEPYKPKSKAKSLMKAWQWATQWKPKPDDVIVP